MPGRCSTSPTPPLVAAAWATVISPVHDNRHRRGRGLCLPRWHALIPTGTNFNQIWYVLDVLNYAKPGRNLCSGGDPCLENIPLAHCTEADTVGHVIRRAGKHLQFVGISQAPYVPLDFHRCLVMCPRSTMSRPLPRCFPPLFVTGFVAVLLGRIHGARNRRMNLLSSSPRRNEKEWDGSSTCAAFNARSSSTITLVYRQGRGLISRDNISPVINTPPLPRNREG